MHIFDINLEILNYIHNDPFDNDVAGPRMNSSMSDWNIRVCKCNVLETCPRNVTLILRTSSAMHHPYLSSDSIKSGRRNMVKPLHESARPHSVEYIITSSVEVIAVKSLLSQPS